MIDIDLWGGVECTVNRVGDHYFDQLAQSGHTNRLADLDLFAEVGFKKMRYPVLWESVAPDHPEQQDWTWARERLTKLRELNIDPIVGLLHHGSGPRYTNLLDDDFPVKFAAYARNVAQQFPWVTYYTPINEPLTTARFSALYGFWYPHAKDDVSFAKALLNQIKGTKLAMQAIREINPAAKLVQTDDLGHTHATPALQYQADFENHRRWLTWDLLCGHVTETHPLWQYLRWAKVPVQDLLDLSKNPCPPDIIGVNHYVTSERYLDEHIIHYPWHTHGQSKKHHYADVEAVRVADCQPLGVQNILLAVCERYPDIRVAMTEAHLCCTREEQMRWLADAWDAALFLRNQGKNIIAVTAWSLLGAYNWNSLLTEQHHHYELGVFDVRTGVPEPTAVVELLKTLVAGQERPPVLQTDGWWKRICRGIYPCHPETDDTWNLANKFPSNSQETLKPLLITGATGTLGRAFARVCDQRGIAYVLLSRQEMDIANPASVETALQRYQPWALVNTAGYVRVDDAEKEAEACFRENTLGPEILAQHCQKHNVPMVTFSSDLVFDGQQQGCYLEEAAVHPCNVYGQSKAQAEAKVLAAYPAAIIIRTSAFFGPWDQHNFVFHALRAMAHQEPFQAADDCFITPTYVPDLVNTALDLLIDQESGIWHLANTGTYSWAQLAELAARLAGLEPDGLLQPVPQSSFGMAAARPPNTALATSKRAIMPSVEDALHRYLHQTEFSFRPLGSQQLEDAQTEASYAVQV